VSGVPTLLADKPIAFSFIVTYYTALKFSLRLVAMKFVDDDDDNDDDTDGI